MNINKNYLLTFGISVLVMLTISIIVLMLMLPKQSSVAKGTIKSYDSISKSEYTFEATKAISSEPLKKQYSISAADMSGFKYNTQYKTGNTDPFSESESSNSETSSNSTTTTTTTTTSEKQNEATNKTTNSNGGVANPPATSK